MGEPKGRIMKLTDRRRDGPVSIRVAPFRDEEQLEVWIVLITEVENGSRFGWP